MDASSTLAPSTNGRLAQFGRRAGLRNQLFGVRLPGRPPKFQASGGKEYAARSKRAVFGRCGFDSHLAYHAPVADGEADGLQSRDSRFESVPGCHAPDAEVDEAAGRKPALT